MSARAAPAAHPADKSALGKSGLNGVHGLCFAQYQGDQREASMRVSFLLAAAAAAAAALSSQAPTARAQSAAYPFCAVYASKGGTPSCHFATREQCLADISGLGGQCVGNSSYRAGTTGAAPRRQSAGGRVHHARRAS